MNGHANPGLGSSEGSVLEGSDLDSEGGWQSLDEVEQDTGAPGYLPLSSSAVDSEQIPVTPAELLPDGLHFLERSSSGSHDPHNFVANGSISSSSHVQHRQAGLPLQGQSANSGADNQIAANTRVANGLAAAAHELASSSSPMQAVQQDGDGSFSPEPSIPLDEDKRTAILGAMKNVHISYVPPWAVRLSDREWSQALLNMPIQGRHEQRTHQEPHGQAEM